MDYYIWRLCFCCKYDISSFYCLSVYVNNIILLTVPAALTFCSTRASHDVAHDIDNSKQDNSSLAKDFYSTFNREKNAKLDTHSRVTMYHYAQYLSPLAGLSSHLYAGEVLEINSLKHLLSIVVDNNNVLLDGGSL